MAIVAGGGSRSNETGNGGLQTGGGRRPVWGGGWKGQGCVASAVAPARRSVLHARPSAFISLPG